MSTPRCFSPSLAGPSTATDRSLVAAAVRELVEETGVDPTHIALVSPTPCYVEFGQVPARSAKHEPAHFHLDFGYAFTTTRADIGDLQASEVTGAGWHPLAAAERLVGSRIARAVSAPAHADSPHRSTTRTRS